MRALVLMAEARGREEWLRTARLVTAVYNSQPREKPVQLQQVYPYKLPPVPEPTEPTLPMAMLKDLYLSAVNGGK